MEHVITLHRLIQDGILPDLYIYQCRMEKTSIYDVVMATNRHGDTAFLTAARHGHVTILKQLHVEYGVELNHSNQDGKTALHESAQNGHIECVNYLIKCGSSVDCLKRSDWTPLMLACSKCNLQVIVSLIENGASLHLRNKDGWTPFHIASREGNTDILKYLLMKDPLCWKTYSSNMRTPFHTMSLYGHLNALKLLLNYCTDYDINVQDSCGITPLMDAVKGSHLHVTQLLLSFGADIHVRDNVGRHCIHIGAQCGSVGVLDYMITSLKIDVNMTTDTNLSTSLHYAAKDNQYEAIILLLKFGGDPNIIDHHGRTALDIARNTNRTTASIQVLEKLQ